ncbi:carbohydrate kinase family protein [Candidatus Aerophobetes bacterium]|nr:carbohydrate kinase family protein [Candidatus Aerophobetes bacterium]
MDVVGLGALNVDLIYQVDPLLLGLEAGRERVGSYHEFEDLLNSLKNKAKLRIKNGGGSAANTIYALAKMGFSCGYLGKIGKDEEGDFLLEGLMKVGVNTERIKRGGRSGLCVVLLGEGKDRSIIILPQTNDTLSYSDLDPEYVDEAEFLHMSSFLGDVPFEAQKRIARKTRAKISFDPGEPHASKGMKELIPILERTFILFSTGREVEILTHQDYKEGCKEILKLGIEIIACKLGEKGSYILCQEEELEISPQRGRIVDSTGAGDVYAAGFLAGLLKKLSLADCARLATFAASQSIRGFGRKTYPGQEILSGFTKKGR